MDGDPERAGPYALLARLGSGAPLFLGEPAEGDGHDGRRVAVRIVRDRLAADDELRGRLVREMAAAQRVSGPNLAPLVAAGLAGPRPWIAWLHLPGPSLDTLMSRHEALTMSQVAALATGLAGALHALHDAGVTHGDLYPGNVFVSDGVPWLAGFGTGGAAAALAGLRPSPGARDFLAPEQAAGQPATMPGDVFGLAAVLVRATGETGPFRIGVQGAPWVNLGGIAPEIRPLVARCLDVDPGQRPTVAEVGAVLTAAFPDVAPILWSADEPDEEQVAGPVSIPVASPRPVSTRVRAAAGRGARRPAVWVGAACAVIVALGAVRLAATSDGPAASQIGTFQLFQAYYRAGECLTGDINIITGNGDPSQEMVSQVPCGQPHLYEVLYANFGYWPRHAAFPGTSAVDDQGKAECAARFAAYVGVPLGQPSKYGYTDIVPDNGGSWASGVRTLACIAFSMQMTGPDFGFITGSMKGTGQ